MNWEVKKRLSKFHYIFLNFPFQTSLVFPLVRTLPFDFNLSELEKPIKTRIAGNQIYFVGLPAPAIDVFMGLNKN